MAALPLIGIGLAIGGGVTSGIGQWKAGTAARKEGEAAQRAKESEATLLDYNARVADLQSGDAIERGHIDESRFRSSVRGAIGGQRASAAGQNVSVASGSPLDIFAETARLGELDALQIRQNAMREAWGYQVEAYDTRARADITRQEGAMALAAGKAQQTASRLGAVTSVLGTGAAVATNWPKKVPKPPQPRA